MSGVKGNGEEFAKFAGAVARDLFGEPNKHLSTKDELRFGSNGSMSVKVAEGTFFDHEQKIGGGVLWAIEQATGKPVEGGHAVQWLRDNGYPIEDNRAPQQSTANKGGDWTPPGIPDHAKLTAAYDYVDAGGTVRYQVVRYDWDDPASPKGHDKNFRQRQPDKSKKFGWNWKVRGLEPLPYRLPDLIDAISQDVVVFIVEGEKAADRLAALGVPATTNSGGAGKFPDAIVEFFKGAKVVILPDNDTAGKEHLKMVGNKLDGVASSVRYLELPGLPPKGDVVDWIDAGGDLDQLYDLVDRSSRMWEPTPFESRFGAVTWSDLDQPGPVYDELIKGVLTRGELSLLLGESQSGKTFLAVDINGAVARGIPWFGRRVRQGLVIYQAGESATGVRRKRLPAYRIHHNVAHEAVPFVLLQSPLDLYSSDDPTEAFIEECKHWSRVYGVPLELITIDTFNKATPGANENDGKDMGIVLARCDRIRKATGAHVMLVHHLNAGGSKARGHTSLFANVENVILCRLVPDHSDADGRKVREAVIAKQKDGEDGVSIKFVLPQVEIGTDSDGDRITSCVVAPPAGEAGQTTPKNNAVQLGGANQKVLRALYDALNDSLTAEAAPRDLNLPAGAKWTSRKAHGARFAEVEKPDNFDSLSEDEKEKERNRIRQALKRARDTLYAKKIIGMDDEHVWLTGKPVMGFGPPPGVEAARRKSKPAEEAPPPPDLPFDVTDEDIRSL